MPGSTAAAHARNILDVNGDGVVNILDYQALYKLVQKPAHGGTPVVVEPARTGSAPAAEA